MTDQPRILVVGGGSGIGDCITDFLVRKHNAKVIVQSLHVSDRVERLALQGQIILVHGDATKRKVLDQTFNAVQESLGCLDALVITMGVIGEIETVSRMDVSKMRAAFEVNLFVPVQLCQQYLPLLRKTQGRIIVLSSAVDNEVKYAGWSPYCSSKAALTRFIQVLGHEEDEVRIFGVYPGLSRTPMVTDLVSGRFRGKMKDDEIAEFQRRDCDGEIEPPEWTANVVAKLAVSAVHAGDSGSVRWYHEIDPNYKG